MSFLTSLYNTLFGPGTPQDPAAAKNTVESLISGNRIAIFSKSYCPYCSEAKTLLANLGEDISKNTIELDNEKNGSAIQSYLATRANTSRVTVPQIYINQKLVGGCSDLKALHAQGKLREYLKQV